MEETGLLYLTQMHPKKDKANTIELGRTTFYVFKKVVRPK